MISTSPSMQHGDTDAEVTRRMHRVHGLQDRFRLGDDAMRTASCRLGSNHVRRCALIGLLVGILSMAGCTAWWAMPVSCRPTAEAPSDAKHRCQTATARSSIVSGKAALMRVSAFALKTVQAIACVAVSRTMSVATPTPVLKMWVHIHSVTTPAASSTRVDRGDASRK